MPRKSTTDTVFALRMLIKKYREGHGDQSQIKKKCSIHFKTVQIICNWEQINIGEPQRACNLMLTVMPGIFTTSTT